MPSLNETLLSIAAQLRIDGNELIRYAIEDTIGGYHIDESKRVWPMGSLWSDEGKILYALIRATKPETVVQVGGWVGCSASHLALACVANNKGRVVSIDNGQDGLIHGELIPSHLRERIELVFANGEDWLAAQADGSIDFVFEDAGHSRESVATISKVALQKLAEGGLLVNHDAAHDFAFVGGGAKIHSGVGKEVRDGLEDAGARFKPYRTDDSDCGLAISVKATSIFAPDVYSVKSIPYVEITETDDSPLVTDKMDSTSEPEKTKRTRRKRNAKTGELE